MQAALIWADCGLTLSSMRVGTMPMLNISMRVAVAVAVPMTVPVAMIVAVVVIPMAVAMPMMAQDKEVECIDSHSHQSQCKHHCSK